MLDSLLPELYKLILVDCSVVSLLRLSATCKTLRKHVHEFIKSRLSVEAAADPDIRESLSRLGWKREHELGTCSESLLRLGWKKDHELGTCDCFKIMAGPCFTWQRMKKIKCQEVECFSEGSNMDLPKHYSTAVAGKIFVIELSRNILYWENTAGSAEGQHSPRRLVLDNAVINCIASYHNILAHSRREYDRDRPFRTSICIHDPRECRKITEIDIKTAGDERILEVNGIAFSDDTMIVHYKLITAAAAMFVETNTCIEIWKINTSTPQEEGIVLLNTISHDNAPLSTTLPRDAPVCVNDRFIAIADFSTVAHHSAIKLFDRSKEEAENMMCIRQFELDTDPKHLVGIAVEKRQGDHIAVAFKNHYSLVVQVYSVTGGQMIIQKEISGIKRPWLSYVAWFGQHLVVVSQEGDGLLMSSWQPGRTSFLNCPITIPLTEPSPRDEDGCPADWEIACLHVDYRGVTTVQRDKNLSYQDKDQMTYFQTWDARSSKLVAFKTFRIQSKKFYIDVMENERGKYIKVVQTSADGMKNKMNISMDSAAKLRKELESFGYFYISLGPEKEENMSGNVLLKTAIIVEKTKRYFLDFMTNGRVRFLKISQVVWGGPRKHFFIPALGIVEWRNNLAQLLQQFGMEAAEDEDEAAENTYGNE